MVGHRDVELVEEQVRELRVVMLPAVHQDLVHPSAQRARERRRLHELRAVADD